MRQLEKRQGNATEIRHASSWQVGRTSCEISVNPKIYRCWCCINDGVSMYGGSDDSKGRQQGV